MDDLSLDALFQLTLELLRDLVRIDTTNPPGNETLAARYLQDRLASEGIESQLVEPAPGRGNVIARLTGPSTIAGEGLLLLSHLDVVNAEPDQWQVPPFSGEIADGAIWGRGTLDTKNLTAAETAITIWLRRLGVELRREVILAATADEESGGGYGVRWLAENRLDLVRASAAINEGGGIGAALAGQIAYLVQTAEKAPCPVTVTARGVPGHASTPMDDNAVVTLSRALVAIGSRRLPVHITGTYRGFVDGLGSLLGGIRGVLAQQLLNPSLVDSIIERVAGDDPRRAAGMRAMIRNTATPTMVNAGYRINVIPGQAQAQLDCRVLPGSGSEELLSELRAVLRDAGLADKVEVSAGQLSVPTAESPFDHELVGHMRAAIGRHADGAKVVPFLVPGATDGRFLRPHGIPVYGFMPLLPSEKAEGVHGHNERLSLDSLRFAVKVLWDVISAYCV
jgi:acetylornithine deacetylase/succinyl-diaminopimelate desuccinylase-like protein